MATGHGRWLTDDDWRWGTPRWSPGGDRIATTVGLERIGSSGQALRIVGLDGSVTAPNVPDATVIVSCWLADGRLAVVMAGPRDRPAGSISRLFVVDGEQVRPVSVDGSVRLFGDVYGDSPAELADSYDLVMFAEHGSSVVLRTGDRGRMGIARVDVDTGTIDWLVNGDRCCSPVAICRDTLVFSTQTCEQPAEVAVLAGVTADAPRRERRLTTFTSELTADVTSRRFVVDTPAGWPLDAWFLSPSDAPRQPLPTVLLIHGGPSAAFGESFIIDAHALCGAGFGVLFTNPRVQPGGAMSSRTPSSAIGLTAPHATCWR